MENEFEMRLTRQVEELVRLRVSLLEQDISRVQREVNEAFTRLLESTDAAAALPDSNRLLAKLAAEVSAQIGHAGADSARLGSDLALLRDSVTEMGQQPTQAEVLNTLVARASSFAPRIVLFVVKGANALGWAARGFDDGVGNSAIRGLSISLQADTILSAALNSQQAFYGPLNQQTENQTLLSRLGPLQPERALAIPLKVRGKSAAVLYADSGDSGPDVVNVEAAELLVSTAGLVIELTSLRTRVGEATARGEVPRPKAETPAAGVSGPVAQSARTSGSQPGRPGDPQQAASTSKTFFRPAAETPHSGEFQVNPTTPRSASSAAAQPAEKVTSGSLRAGPVEEEEKQHNDARKFARLLVSEIKLYNEGKVVEGRRNHDLYDRLKEDIDRSRQMYDRRVTAGVAAKFDYFYDELVNTLAEGDPSKLGSDFPGPSARA